MRRLLPVMVSLAAAVVVVSGCADFENPNIGHRLTHPLDQPIQLRIGMSKQTVLDGWGQPKEIISHGRNAWGDVQEEWVYTAPWPRVPGNIGYLSKDKRLFFDGDSLTRWVDEAEQPQQPAGGPDVETSTK